jgi:DNA repair exonuclease SbcCD ATPase subunit
MKKKITLNECYELFKKYGDIGIKVNTPYGFKKINGCEITEYNSNYISIKTENGLKLEGSKKHRVKTKNGTFVELDKLTLFQEIQTNNGNQRIIEINNLGLYEDLYDIEVDEVKQYYSNGIVSHNSTLGIDLVLFLFFNTTTKTKTNGEIFNRFSDVDEVKVTGELVIDGQDFVIERKLNRKKSKQGDYTVTNKLEFYRKNEKGEIENLNGEQRKETETLIESAIGNEEVFLSTILTTGYNLEELIDSKPTARGAILTKFLGLETLKEKETIAKGIYNDWSRTLISNIHNTNELEIKNKISNESIEDSRSQIVKIKNELSEFKVLLEDLENRRDNALKSRNNDVDMDLIRTNPVQVNNEINDLVEKQRKSKLLAEEVKVIEPSKYYLEDNHDKLKSEIQNILIQQKTIIDQIGRDNGQIKRYLESSECPTCKRPLDGVDFTKEIDEIKQNIQLKETELNEIKLKIDNLNTEDEVYKKLKSELDSYEKNKLIKARYELEVEQKQLEIDTKQLILKRYNDNKKKMEDNQKIDTELMVLKTKIETNNANIKQSYLFIERHENNIKTLIDKIAINNDLITKIKSEQDLIPIFQTYLGIYGKNGISKVILKNMIPLLNSELQRLLVDSCYFTLELSINDKNEVEFIMIDNETRVVKPLNSGSGYEKTISSLALRCVLTKVSSLPKPNIVVMDEVFGKIADENLEMVGEFFKKIKNYFEHIVIISHNPLIRNWSDNLLMIKKDENISTIDYIKTKIS